MKTAYKFWSFCHLWNHHLLHTIQQLTLTWLQDLTWHWSRTYKYLKYVRIHFAFPRSTQNVGQFWQISSVTWNKTSPALVKGMILQVPYLKTPYIEHNRNHPNPSTFWVFSWLQSVYFLLELSVETIIQNPENSDFTYENPYISDNFDFSNNSDDSYFSDNSNDSYFADNCNISDEIWIIGIIVIMIGKIGEIGILGNIGIIGIMIGEISELLEKLEWWEAWEMGKFHRNYLNFHRKKLELSEFSGFWICTSVDTYNSSNASYITLVTKASRKIHSVLEPSGIPVIGTPSISLISNFINCMWTLYKKSISVNFQWNSWRTYYLLVK